MAKSEKAIRADEDRKIAAAARLKGVASHGSGFMSFVREQGVVGLAVGLAIGTAAGASVKVIVDEFISPIVALLTRGVDLNSLKWVILEKTADQPEVAIGWGAILSSVITLLATAFVIYQLVHIAKLDRIDKKKD
ncbi:MAG: MscL family protein [Candidatus Saccharibacteria bacterium]|jgi:large conductance mechanosensitive channel protein|nr:MscL family protein [Candidatus Saccharibacteria bacterium]HPQ82665.1 MscL family protein [Candidatus Saccharimonas sp.]